jgi:HEAT repeat protein
MKGKGQDLEIRGKAVKSLGRIGSNKAVEPLIVALKDLNLDSYVRVASAVGLGNIASDKAVEPLIVALADTDRYVRIAAVGALGNIASDKAVEPLIVALADTDRYVQIAAVGALSNIASDKAVESLIAALNDTDEDMRMRAIEALANIDKAVEPLIVALTDVTYHVRISGVYFVRISAAKALGKIAASNRNLPILPQQLPHLLTLIPTKFSQQARSVITAIQARCKYYNYAIYDTPLQETENYANPVEKILQEIHQTLKTMSETGKYNFKADVVQIIENNTGEVIAKKYANDPALLQTINEITQVLANLQKAHPTATEAEAKDIIEAEFKEIQNNQPNRWSTFRQQLLTPERWLNGGKATISEIAKHYAENSVFLKAGVAFLDGFSADEE